MAIYYPVTIDAPAVKRFLAAEKMSIKDFAGIIKCTPQHLSGVLSGRLAFAESLKEKILAEIEKRNENKFSTISEKSWINDTYSVKVRFTSWEWHNITRNLPSDLDLEEKLRDFVLFELLPHYGDILIEKESLPPQE